METFHWKVRPDMNVVSEPKVVTVKLGDGYEQRRAAGLNNQLSIYSVTIRVRKCEHPSLKAFLERHVASAHFSGRHLMTGSRSGWFVVNGRQAWGRCG
ncbi:Minor tail protein M [Escherichia coli]|nr:Minor tail protein M [Escherichia coli]